MHAGFDPEILQDFLTESGELLARLEGDLVTLESSPRDPELLNQVFRALHTIKGSASFLQLTNLVRVAHAAESALNAARNSVVVVDAGVMNLLLEAVDLLKVHMGQVQRGEELTAPREQLVAILAAIGEGKQVSEGDAPAPPTPAASPAPDAPHAAHAAHAAHAPHAPHAPAAPSAGNSPRKLALGPGKADLLEYLVADLDETMGKVRGGLDQLAGGGEANASGKQLAETCEALGRCVEFFEFGQMGDLARAVGSAAARVASAEAALESVLPSVREIYALLEHQAQGIKAGEVREVAADDALDRLERALRGERDDVKAAPATPVSDEAAGPGPAPVAPASVQPAMKAESGAVHDAKKSQASGASPAGGAANAESNTIRVEVGRLETLMNLVGELVLQKNRIGALARRVAASGQVQAEMAEQLGVAGNALDRVTGDIQLAVMRTRMQPLDKLFGRYPRLIRDLAGKTGKKINLVIEGGETEVDRSVIEELGDPLVHLIRNSCDHGLEKPEERVRAGKGEAGTITLRASHEGSHVRVQIIDDGRGLSRERIGKKAVERGLATPEQMAQLPDRDVWNFIFEPGFSTADVVSDLSGRGVGMDVVRTNIQKLKGSIELFSESGKGTTISITIPLTVAILPAMMVGVGPEIYAVPLTSILEIVRPMADQVSSIGGRSVMRLRDTVLPLVEAAELFGLPEQARQQSPYAVVVHTGEKRVGLMVSHLIGQQEVVIKPLDEAGQSGRCVSGATVRDDGGVSLIVDVDQLVRAAQG